MKFLFLLLFLSLPVMMAGKVHINLPHFAGKAYVYYLMQGEATDTIMRGSLDEKGQTVLSLPKGRETFQGMSKFMLIGGGGLEIILNSEPDFTISCTEALPDMSNIFYIGSEENNFLFSQYRKQGEILDKSSVIGTALQVYSSPEHPLHEALLTEQLALQEEYELLQLATATSPLYSARIREMSDFMTLAGSKLSLSEEEAREERRTFAASKLDINQLYNSGLWNDLLTQWVSMSSSLGDSILLEDCRQVLARTTRPDIRQKLLGKLTLLFYKYGKENLLHQLGEDDLLAPGNKAPMLRLDNVRMFPVSSLVIFYESGCNSCENELIQLRANYPVIQEMGLRVISVAADADEETYRRNADLFPWRDKYCDYKGFAGENFVNYNIPATPTIFVIDNDGIITGRYAWLADCLKELKTKN